MIHSSQLDSNANELRQRREILLERYEHLEHVSRQCQQQSNYHDSIEQAREKCLQDIRLEQNYVRAAERRHAELVEEYKTQQQRKMQQEIWEQERKQTQTMYFNARFYEERRKRVDPEAEIQPLRRTDRRRHRQKVEVDEEPDSVFRKWWDDQVKTREARNEKQCQDYREAPLNESAYQADQERRGRQQGFSRSQQQSAQCQKDTKQPPEKPSVVEGSSCFRAWCQMLDESLPEGEPVSKHLERFPSPPVSFCRQHAITSESSRWHMRTCECSIKAMLEDEHGSNSEAYTKTLRSLRNRLHPDKFSSCDNAGVKAKATQMTQILNNLCAK